MDRLLKRPSAVTISEYDKLYVSSAYVDAAKLVPATIEVEHVPVDVRSIGVAVNLEGTSGAFGSNVLQLAEQVT
ncbi:MAG: hypothetical protein BWY47_00224 [Bacteroidetes bacterium ADurb.Bin302]|nr:MAG: hypothetical protein BWY47_00224 [Bacteroidetes bacterium ADurb.Bin302]